jgi:cobalamin biosynthetic protein CobC
LISSASHGQLRHGGDIGHAITRFGGSADLWLDLSTGISPWSYPTPEFESSTWRNLPPTQDQLLIAAAKYYDCDASQIVATPGSQLAIRLIPRLIAGCQSVAVPLIGYQEHASSWEIAGHHVVTYKDGEELFNLVNNRRVMNAVVINPNNPSGEHFSEQFLSSLSSNLGGILLIDEAFSDLKKLVENTPRLVSFNTIVLKSIGKFFGLAGARIGFVIGADPVVNELGQLLAPWSLAAPSIELATMALADSQWQTEQALRVKNYAKRQNAILLDLQQTLGNSTLVDGGLFFTLFAPDQELAMLHLHLAKHKIWTRLGDPYQDQNDCSLNWLRFSLAGENLGRLSEALTAILKN